MPRIVVKHEVREGRGLVVLYSSSTSAGSFFYPELIQGTRTYGQRRISGVTTRDDNVKTAAEVTVGIQAQEQEKPEIARKLVSRGRSSSRSKSQREQTVRHRTRRQLIENPIRSLWSKSRGEKTQT